MVSDSDGGTSDRKVALVKTACAYDRAATKFRGVEANKNSTLKEYDDDLKQAAHRDPESSMKQRLVIGSKNGKLVIPSPLKSKPTVVNGADIKPWLESDCEDDFYSIKGDFSPSCGNTPVLRQSFSEGTPVIFRDRATISVNLQEEDINVQKDGETTGIDPTTMREDSQDVVCPEVLPVKIPTTGDTWQIKLKEQIPAEGAFLAPVHEVLLPALDLPLLHPPQGNHCTRVCIQERQAFQFQYYVIDTRVEAVSYTFSNQKHKHGYWEEKKIVCELKEYDTQGNSHPH
nr:putative -like protein [Ipomoea batatas]GMC67179.1 putative -like protein [Ipomoea batatas]